MELNRDLYFNQFWCSLVGKLQRKKNSSKTLFQGYHFKPKTHEGEIQINDPLKLKPKS